MRRYPLILLLSLCAVTAAIAEERPRIGISIPLTGETSTYGNDMRKTFVFANEKLTHNRYELIFEDDLCDGRAAVTVAKKLLDIEKVQYMLGFACSGTLLSTANIYEKAQVPVITSSASATSIAKAGDYIFRTFPADQGAAKKLVEYVAQHHKVIAVLSEQTDYAQGLGEDFVRFGKRPGVRFLEESFVPGTSDFRPVLLRLRAAGAEAIFINSQYEAAFLRALKQLRELNLPITPYGAYWPASEQFLEKAQGLAEGIIFVDSPSPADVLTKDGLTIYEEYKTRHGKLDSIELVFAASFEAFRALTQAIESGQDIRHYLYNTKFHGIIGDWSFDQDGEISGIHFVLKEVKAGKAVPFQP